MRCKEDVAFVQSRDHLFRQVWTLSPGHAATTGESFSQESSGKISSLMVNLRMLLQILERRSDLHERELRSRFEHAAETSGQYRIPRTRFPSAASPGL